MAAPRPSVILLWGEDPFLLREAARELLGDLRATEIEAQDWQGGETADLATPSLFGEQRALIVTDCRHLPEHAVRELSSYLEAPAEDSLLVLVAQVGERAKAPAQLAKLLKDRGEVRQVALARKELSRWIVDRAKRKELSIRADAAAALVEHLGESPAVLDAALEQLGAAFPGQAITKDAVASQFRGLGEQHLWDLCDRAFGKDVAGAERALGSLLAMPGGDPSLPILGGIASRLRDLLRVKAVPESAPPAEVARAAGLRFEWQGRRYRDQAKRFTMDELVAIHDEVVEADRVMKSGAPGTVVLPVLVATIAADAS